MRKFIGLLTAWGLLVGCATTTSAPAYEPLKASVEALYLNYRDLKNVHSDLRAALRLHIEASGEQLAEIQSAARFIQQANLIAFYQWELLAITAYIRDDARHDFFTLRSRDLIDARDKTHDLVLSVRVYEAFIRDTRVLEQIAACLRLIEKHMALYQQMAQALQQFIGGDQANLAKPDVSRRPIFCFGRRDVAPMPTVFPTVDHDGVPA